MAAAHRRLLRAAVAGHRGARRALAVRHRTIVVPLLGDEESEHALDLACKLAAERRSHVLLLAPLFVEAELPLDAHFDAEERELRAELVRTRALAERYGISTRSRIVRTRHGQLGAAVARVADERRATLVVVGAPPEPGGRFHRPFSRDIWSILQDAPCRVLVAAGPRVPSS